MNAIAIILAAGLFSTSLAQADELSACASSPQVVGTKRILGVADPTGNVAGDNLVPESIDRAFTAPCDKAAFGDFTVCPLEKDKPGVMRRVCIAKTERVRFQDEW